MKKNRNFCVGPELWLWSLGIGGVASGAGLLLAWAIGNPHALSMAAAPIPLVLLFWLGHLPRMPSLGSLYPHSLRHPPPTSWCMVLGGVLAFVAATVVLPTNTGLPGRLAAAMMAAAFALVGATLALPRVLARQAQRRPPTPKSPQEAEIPKASAAEPAPGIANSGPDFSRLGQATTAANAPWAAPIPDSQRIQRVLEWISAPENPITNTSDDLFDAAGKAARLLELLRPMTDESSAGTVHLNGLRGTGKSTLLRLAEEAGRTAGAGGPPGGVELRFCRVSLWEYASTQRALRGALEEVLGAVRERVDILPMLGMPAGVANAIFGPTPFANPFHGISASPLNFWLPALSELLIRARLRVIVCIEDDDRVTSAERRATHGETLQGFLDRLKTLPGFGYVICTSTQTWSEPSPAEKGPPETEEIKKWLAYNKRWGHAGFKPADAPELHPGEILQLREEVGEIVTQRRTQWATATGFLPVPRLCQYSLTTGQHLAYGDLEPIMRVFRSWMVRQIIPDAADLDSANNYCGLDHQQREEYLNSFLTDDSRDGIAIYITPRTLRNGLREAHRRWTKIAATLARAGPPTVPAQQSWSDSWAKGGVDFDSVLAACLVEACYPERWDQFVRACGNNIYNTSFHRNHTRQLKQAYPSAVHGGQATLPGNLARQLEECCWFGFSRSIRNMLHRQAGESGGNGRPGGLVGNGAAANWNLFAQA